MSSPATLLKYLDLIFRRRKKSRFANKGLILNDWCDNDVLGGKYERAKKLFGVFRIGDLRDDNFILGTQVSRI